MFMLTLSNHSLYQVWKLLSERKSSDLRARVQASLKKVDVECVVEVHMYVGPVTAGLALLPHDAKSAISVATKSLVDTSGHRPRDSERTPRTCNDGSRKDETVLSGANAQETLVITSNTPAGTVADQEGTCRTCLATCILSVRRNSAPSKPCKQDKLEGTGTLTKYDVM